MYTEKPINLDIKKINRNRIYSLLRQKGSLSKQDIVFELQLSLPTVTQNLVELQEMNLIEEKGSFGKTGGRNAKAFSVISDAKIAIGLDITGNHITALAVDLDGNVVKIIRVRYEFSISEEYFKKLGDLVEELIESSNIYRTKILGVGIAVPAIISEDRTTIIYGKILDITGETINRFSQYIMYPCVLCNDANAAGFAEIWASKEIKNAFYISLSNNIGGSVLINNQVYTGENQHSGEIGHITVVPDGLPCYCGQNGCLETYCSATVLSDSAYGNLLDFFKLLKDNRSPQVELWEKYLNYLAIAVNNIRMLFDCNVIIGGYVGSYMEEYIDKLRALASRRNTFEKDADYVKVCKYKTEAIAAGAALPYINDFLNNI